MDLLDALEYMSSQFEEETDLMLKGEKLNACHTLIFEIDNNFATNETAYHLRKKLLLLKNKFDHAHAEFIIQFEFEKIKVDILKMVELLDLVTSKSRAQNIEDSSSIIKDLTHFILKYQDGILLNHFQSKFIQEAQHILDKFQSQLEFSLDTCSDIFSSQRSQKTYRDVSQPQSLSYQNDLSFTMKGKKVPAFEFKKRSGWKTFKQDLFHFFSCSCSGDNTFLRVSRGQSEMCQNNLIL